MRILRSFANRFLWVFWERLLLKFKIKGFYASPFSYVWGKFEFDSFVSIARGCILSDVSIGSYTYLSANTQGKYVTIGRFCSIGQDVLLGGLAAHPKNISTHPVFYSKLLNNPYLKPFSIIDDYEHYRTTIIGHDVWIGDRSIILPGVSIGTGAIVAAGAVVTKNIDPYSIVGGVPAKKIGSRISDESTLQRVLSTNWWSWDEEKLAKCAHIFKADDFSMLLEKANKNECMNVSKG